MFPARTSNGLPPDAPGTLYTGKVMHRRFKPVTHHFVYEVFNLLVDIDRLGDLARQTRGLKVNRPGVAAFYESDHVNRKGETLRQHVDYLLREAGLESPAHKVWLLACPRLFGYVFNPLSVFFAYDRDGVLLALIYAVRNTFGERHSYVARVQPGDVQGTRIHQTRTKIFHVSPFIPMGTRYHFRILPPGQRVSLHIHETEADTPLLLATFDGEAVTLDDRSLRAHLWRFPFMTFKVITAIHWQALKLWLKGLRFLPSPGRAPEASFRDAGAMPSETARKP